MGMNDVAKKHLGARLELVACAWLLEHGYEVFRNVSPHGLVDIVATKAGKITMIDVKSTVAGSKLVPGVSKEQFMAGVQILEVKEFDCVLHEIPRILGDERFSICKNCNKSFRQVRHTSVFCCTKCRAKSSNDRNKARANLACDAVPPAPIDAPIEFQRQEVG